MCLAFTSKQVKYVRQYLIITSWVVCTPPIYTWGDWGTEGLSNLPKDVQQVNIQAWAWIQTPNPMIWNIRLKLHFCNFFQSWLWSPRSGTGRKIFRVNPLHFIPSWSLLSWAPSCCVTVLIYHPLNQLIPLVLKLQCIFMFMYFPIYFLRDLEPNQILFCNPYKFIKISMHFLQNQQYFFILLPAICRDREYLVTLEAVIKICNLFHRDNILLL